MLGITLDQIYPREVILTRIIDACKMREPLHIVSLNPENMMTAQAQPRFARILATAPIQIIDGVGVYVAARLKGELPSSAPRLTGVDLMQDIVHTLMSIKFERPVSVCFLGGRQGAAAVVQSYFQDLQLRHPESHLDFHSIPDLEYDDPRIIDKLHIIKPQLLFVAFGSPTQEIWIDDHKLLLRRTVCMGVGGAYDMVSGRTPRAPAWVRSMGAEWLYRLILQPWRIKRQIALLRFLSRIVLG